MTTTTLPIEKRRATVRQLADDGLSNRAIGRQLGIHHRTVASDLLATPAPADAPPGPTSGDLLTPRLLYPLTPQLVQDLNVLHDPATGELPAPLARAIHEAANRKRARWMTLLREQAPAAPPHT
ncbi:hypothetical protein ACFQ6B_23730 [Streptomyces wedmorensis]|uniref:Uncharacterized protein n=1 Tax=Streptomyces wedmorensis TaxID=43759 RepID=A0ABW6J8Z8_STRWE